ncbi:response regulator transcription factor [Microbispora sp. H10836]|uniref:response regulator n=1 Tax=Microbispora sp. H10836 TaxID=2729106 RepID=UPI001473907A|nr:response regulator transcription factor [Microbispora sp. H10836]
MTGNDAAILKVLVVDDHTVVRRGITSYFDLLDDIELVDEAYDGRNALDKLAALSAYDSLPDVVLMDLLMPRMDGIAATAEIRRRYPAVAVVVMTSFGETQRVHAALEAGATGYLLKDAGPAEVAAAVRAAFRDEVFIDPAVARALTREMVAPPTGTATLTDRERTVLILVAEGKSNREIARELDISERTARTHVSNMLTKLRLQSRTQAALLAIKEGLVNPS